MSNIEQKVFATQKNVDSMQKVAAKSGGPGDSLTMSSKRPKSPPKAGTAAQPDYISAASDETFKQMLKTLQQQ